MNIRIHGQSEGQEGHLELGNLIPEVATGIDYCRRPHRTDAGNFSLAGMASMTTAVRFESPFGMVQVGQLGYGPRSLRVSVRVRF